MEAGSERAGRPAGLTIDDPEGRARAAGRSLLLVANARASGVEAADVAAAERELRDAGAAVETRLTADTNELAAALADADGRRVVLLGGDGSLHLAANLGYRGELALVPAGRANNIARSLGIPRARDAAARLAAGGEARPFDLLEARAGERTHLAAEGISVGFLARARTLYTAPNSAAIGAGLRAGLATLRKFRPSPVVVTVNGRRVELTVAQLFVANTPLYAFGLRVAPVADPRDGRADTVALSPNGVAGLLGLAPRVWRGTHLASRAVRAWRSETVTIDPLGLSPVVADSTDLGPGPVEIGVRAGALQVVAP